MNKRTKNITHAALIAALYVVLTYVANMFGMANGVIQLRFSEALCILPYYTAAAVPGLFVGCLLSNFLTGCTLVDVIVGSFATLLGAVITRKLRRNKWLAPLGPVLCNTFMIPFVLLYAYGIRPLWFSFLTVFAGEVLSSGVMGMILLFALQKNKDRIFGEE